MQTEFVLTTYAGAKLKLHIRPDGSVWTGVTGQTATYALWHRPGQALAEYLGVLGIIIPQEVLSLMENRG